MVEKVYSKLIYIPFFSFKNSSLIQQGQNMVDLILTIT